MIGKSIEIVNVFFSLAYISGFAVVNMEVQRNYLIQMTEIQCNYNSSHIRSLECSMRNDSSNKNVLDVRMELATTVEDFNIRTLLHFKRPNMQRMTILDLTLNGCQFLSCLQKHTILRIVVNTLKRVMNIMPECPIRKDFNYTIAGYYLNELDFPTYLPECQFVSTNYFLYHNKLVAVLTVWGHVEKRDLKQTKKTLIQF